LRETGPTSATTGGQPLHTARQSDAARRTERTARLEGKHLRSGAEKSEGCNGFDDFRLHDDLDKKLKEYLDFMS
jgi:hypothetical protein